MRGGDLRAPAEAARGHAVVEHLGGDHAEVDDVGAGGDRALGERPLELRPRQARVPAGAHARRPELLRERVADAPRHVGVDLLGVEAADVVGLEDAFGDRHPDSLPSTSLNFMLPSGSTTSGYKHKPLASWFSAPTRQRSPMTAWLTCEPAPIEASRTMIVRSMLAPAPMRTPS